MTIVNRTAINFLLQGIFCKCIFPYLLNRHMSGIVGHGVGIYKTLVNFLYHCIFPPAMCERSSCSTFSPIVGVVNPSHFSQSSGCVIISYYGFILHSLVD